MRAPAFWWRAPGLASALLAPFGAIYGAVAASRLRQAGAHAGVPVICVGNPTLGGAGKTPTAIMIAQRLRARGLHVAMLTRGYGGDEPGPHLVDLERDAAKRVGDEPLLLAQTAPTVVARDRAAGAAFAVARGAQVIVMDDGFQNPSLHKTLSLLVVDGAVGLGNGRVFPAGPLRAPLAPQLARAQGVVIVGDGAPGDAVARLANDSGLPTLRARLTPRNLPTTGARLLAFAGIGRPEKFVATLTAAGHPPARLIAFPDHHRFTTTDAAHLIDTATREGLTLVSTEKDLARMRGEPTLAALVAATHAVGVQLVVDDPPALDALLTSALAKDSI